MVVIVTFDLVVAFVMSVIVSVQVFHGNTLQHYVRSYKDDDG
jgi:hypothetical protein